MEFKEFTEKMASAVEKQMGKGYRVSVQDVKRNNNVTLTGLLVSDGESNVSPFIYLEPFYRAVGENRETFGEAVLNIIGTYMENRTAGHFDISAFAEYGNASNRIRARLVNTEKNKDFLETVPHREFMDLSMVYEAVFDLRGRRQGSITVNYGHMELWGVTEQELFEQAKSNMEAAGNIEITSISEILCSFNPAEETGLEDCNAFPMYVVSNRSRMYGAVAMVNKKTMQEASEIFGRDFMILPSSVHELILVPSLGEPGEAVRMAEMVQEINDTEVAEDEVLSSHVYRYDCQTGNISIAA